MNTIEIQLLLSEDLHERVIAELDEFGGEGYVQEEDQLKAYFLETRWGAFEKKGLTDLLAVLGVNNTWNEQVIPPQDWNEPWEKSIQPIRVGDFYVRPSWAKPAMEEAHEHIEIIIDPKMSFGTGHHETTRLVLHELSSQIKKGDVLLDAGTGTAILAIAAIKKGASSVIGFDVDEWAINNGLENASRNGVDQWVDLRLGSFDVVDEQEFDGILANINLNVLLNHCSFFSSKLQRHGFLILSGVLNKDAASVIHRFESSGFQLLRSTQEGEWYCGVFQKKEQ